MLIADILHSCTDEGVARAAVASIGGDFAEAVRLEAERHGLSIGALTASLVASFARHASERDWRDITASMAGSDQPVLSGLQAMAERGMRRLDAAARFKADRETRRGYRPGATIPVDLCLLASR